MRRRHLISATLGWAAASSAFVARADESLAEKSAATRPIAERYFAAYIAREWDRVEPLLADEASFVDPTTEPVFGKVERRGKPAVIKNFREGYAAIKHMAFTPMRVVISGAHAVFEGTLDWTLALRDGKEAVTRNMPFLTILRIQSGQVIEHIDYADYQPFVEALRRARGPG